MEKIFLSQKEFEGKKLNYFTLGRGEYYKPVWTIWVSNNILKRDEDGNAYIEIPMRNCQIVEIKDNLVLKEGNYNMFIFEVECGYRGEAEILEIKTDADHESFFYDIYESERGNLGISAGAIILTTADKVKIKWKRNGRLYGKASNGITILYIDGKTETIEDVDMQELLREI